MPEMAAERPRSSSDIACTALEYDPENPNPLFVPACSCQRCAPDPLDDAEDPGRRLRVSGLDQRPPVEEISLGSGGTAMLG